MEREQLEAKLREIDSRFAAIKLQHEQDEARAQESENELFKIQGEYRAIQELLAGLPEPEVGKAEQGEEQPLDGDNPMKPMFDKFQHHEPEHKTGKLHPVDETGIPAEGQVIEMGGKKRG